MATGIKDKVAILGMGCSKFGERWNDNAEDLVVEAYSEALEDSGIGTDQIEAAWLGTAIEEQHVGKSGIPLAMARATGRYTASSRSKPRNWPLDSMTPMTR